MPQTWPQLIPLIPSGRVDTAGIFTDTTPLDNAVTAATAYAAAALPAEPAKIGLFIA